MLTQAQADRLIAIVKEAERSDPLNWQSNKMENETLVAIEERGLQFILSLKRNPFEIRLHFRTRDRDIGLVRLDNSHYHPNPDGTEILNQPHLHVFREGFGLAWAEPVTWCDLNDPYGTLERFLGIIRARFPGGVQVEMY
ncbi:MAG: hypothetical protein JJE16_09960 [Nitrospiraceae bacterium]|nr:hypothetical protein [Nitrospiraceae bacterium]